MSRRLSPVAIGILCTAPAAAVAGMLDEWIKDRAKAVAVSGTFGMDFGQAAPAVNIDVDQRGAQK